MFHKKFEHYIIFCLIKQITMILFVCGKPTDSDETKLFTDDQLFDLAESVCYDLEFVINVPLKTCEASFWAPKTRTAEQLSEVTIKCQTNKSMTFHIDPSESYQLVALVPHVTNDSDTLSYINYLVIDPKQDQGVISTTPTRNYTIWRALLEQGSPVEWRGGEQAPEYNEYTVPEHKRYEIKISQKPSSNGSSVLASFTWNTTGDCDIWFDVYNMCTNISTKSTKVLQKRRDDEPHVDFDQPTFDDDCDLEVTGMFGTSHLKYQTHSCKEIDCTPKEIKPPMPDNITIEAIKDSIDTWEVHLNWTLPNRNPDSYKPLLCLQYMVTCLYYYLGMQQKLCSKKCRVKEWRSTTFGCKPDKAYRCLHQQACTIPRNMGGPVPPYKPDDKPSKDSDTEVLEIWSETEDRWEVRADKLVLHEVIGEGAFGVVRRATLAPHGVQVAVKMLKDFPSLDEIRSFRSEMELMKSVGVHPHLVSLVGCCTGRRPLIVAEYCSRGDLLSYLRCTWDVMLSKRNAKYYNNNIDISDYRNDLFKCKTQMESSKLVVNKLYELQEICDKELTALDLLSFCRQIAMGMEFLAANRVVHRDLAARNILVTGDRTLKIADFGLSRDVYEENQYKQKGNGKMPVKWMALESLTRRIYTTQSDVWSFGVVVWEIATVGGAPYASVPGARLPRLLRSGYRMPKPNNCSPQLYDLMLSCWRTHPRERPTFAELHQRLDELLNSACANQYLSLELDADDAPPTPKHHRYIKMLMRGKRSWTRGETYERPLKAAQRTNHYTTPPDSLSAHPV
uniref:receptor protein-tyrosine kinase n=1 Tax=Mamestra brassicae TaxID=55057 RepID=A0A0M3VGH2_MAMBR|nr:Torso [Mamestra brassicae]